LTNLSNKFEFPGVAYLFELLYCFQ